MTHDADPGQPPQPSDADCRRAEASKGRELGNTAFSDGRFGPAAAHYTSGIDALVAAPSLVYDTPEGFAVWATLMINRSACRIRLLNYAGALADTADVFDQAPAARSAYAGFRAAAASRQMGRRKSAGEVGASTTQELDDEVLLEMPALMPPRLLAKLCFRAGQALEGMALDRGKEAAEAEAEPTSENLQVRIALRRGCDALAMKAMEAFRRAVAVHVAFEGSPGASSAAEVRSTVEALVRCQRQVAFHAAAEVHGAVEKRTGGVHGVGVFAAQRPCIATLRADRLVASLLLPAATVAAGVQEADTAEEVPPAIRSGEVVLAELPVALAWTLTFKEAGVARRVRTASERADVGVALMTEQSTAESEDLRRRYGWALALHAREEGAGTEAARRVLTDEELRRQAIWDANAMLLAEVDFRVGGNDYAGRQAEEWDDPERDDTVGGTALPVGPEGARDAVSLSDGVGAAVFIDGSRFNHACNPNCLARFDYAMCELRVVALRDISHGEELTIAYAPPVAEAAAKRARLGFVCQCGFCSGAMQELVEQLHCPKCSLDTAPIPVDPSSTNVSADAAKAAQAGFVRCGACGAGLPWGPLSGSIAAKVREARGLAAAGQRSEASRMLLAVDAGAKALCPHHWLRFSVRLEAMSAGAGAVSRKQHCEDLIRCCMGAIDTARVVFPPKWPVITGLRMHGAFLQAVAARLEHRDSATETDDDDQELFTVEWFAKHCESRFEVFRRMVADAFEEHEAVLGGSVRIFWLRFRTELACGGVDDAADFTRMLSAAPTPLEIED